VNAIFDPSLVLYLPLHEADGSSFMSRDAYGHLCMVTGALWSPRVRSFDGTDDYISITYSNSFASASGISVGCWYKPHANETSTRLVSFSGADNKRGWLLRQAGYKPRFSIHDGTGWVSVYSTSTQTLNQFYFVMGTYDKTSLKIYLDGSLDCTPTAETDDISYLQNSGLFIGVREGLDPTEFFDGDIGDVFVYNRALTPAEIQNIFLATKWRYQ